MRSSLWIVHSPWTAFNSEVLKSLHVPLSPQRSGNYPCVTVPRSPPRLPCRLAAFPAASEWQPRSPQASKAAASRDSAPSRGGAANHDMKGGGSAEGVILGSGKKHVKRPNQGKHPVASSVFKHYGSTN